MKFYLLMGILWALLFTTMAALGKQSMKGEFLTPGGLATNTNALKMSKETTANIASLDRDQGRIYYDTVLNALVFDNGSVIASVAGGTNEFDDNLFRWFATGDNTKEVKVDLSAITTLTTRTLFFPDENIDLGALANDTLSNLGTVLANANINPDGDGTRDIGTTATARWGNIIGQTLIAETAGSGFQIADNAGATQCEIDINKTAPGGEIGDAFFCDNDEVIIMTGNKTGVTDSFDVLIQSGNCVDGTCGDIILRAGKESGTGVDGMVISDRIFMLSDGTSAQPGYSWGTNVDTGFFIDSTYLFGVFDGAIAWNANSSEMRIRGNILPDLDIIYNGSGLFEVGTPDTTGATNSKDMTISTGNCVDGTCGNLLIDIGDETGTGTDGELDIDAPNVDILNAFTWQIPNTWVWTAVSPGQSIRPTTDLVDLGSTGNRFRRGHFNEFVSFHLSSNIIQGKVEANGTGDAPFDIYNPIVTGTAFSKAISLYTSNCTDTLDCGDVFISGGNNSNVTSGDGGNIRATAGTSVAGVEGRLLWKGENINYDGTVSNFNQTVELIADDTNIVLDQSLLFLTSDNVTAINRTFTLEQCAHQGQLITIIWNDSDAGELLDDSAQGTAGNHRLSADWTPDMNDTITLRCNTTDWIELARSAN